MCAWPVGANYHKGGLRYCFFMRRYGVVLDLLATIWPFESIPIGVEINGAFMSVCSSYSAEEVSFFVV